MVLGFRLQSMTGSKTLFSNGTNPTALFPAITFHQGEIMQFGVSLTGMGQQPIYTDMRQSFQEIVEYVRAAANWALTSSTRANTT